MQLDVYVELLGTVLQSISITRRKLASSHQTLSLLLTPFLPIPPSSLLLTPILIYSFAFSILPPNFSTFFFSHLPLFCLIFLLLPFPHIDIFASSTLLFIVFHSAINTNLYFFLLPFTNLYSYASPFPPTLFLTILNNPHPFHCSASPPHLPLRDPSPFTLCYPVYLFLLACYVRLR